MNEDATTRRNVAIAIGVARANPLPYLRGAINGAVDFVTWAKSMGYDAHAITDEEHAVTIERLCSELEETLRGPRIHRFLLYFAGHGLIREAEEGLWLLSDWFPKLRAVAVEALKRRLCRYGIDQIAIFADACRKLPVDVTAADLTPDAVLGMGPHPMSAPPIDKFIATQDGTATFMIPGSDPDGDRCLFSGVLLEGLWGTKSEAFSRLCPQLITSRSLAQYVVTEVKRRSGIYGKPVVPNVSPTFPEGDDIYYGDGPRPEAPEFSAWPLPESMERPSTLAGGGAGFAALVELHDLYTRIREQSRPDHFETHSGFAVEGLRRAWSVPDAVIEQHGEATWWRVHRVNQFLLEEPVPLVIELADNSFAALTCLPEFIGTITAGHSGVSALIYREVFGGQGIAQATEDAIFKLERRSFEPELALDLAIELRQQKHVDPVRGVISAYLYDAIDDVDSIRRIAYYYIVRGQPVPYDIALLARVDLTNHGSRIELQIPAVPARAPRTQTEGNFNWTWSATSACRGTVGGLWPWFRQGWAYVDQPQLIRARDHLKLARFTTLDREGAQMLCNTFGLVSKI